MMVSHYTSSTHKESFKDLISVGTSDSNSKVVDLNRRYINPKFFPRKFKNWPDTFSARVIENNKLLVTRTDVDNGGWGENLLIDVAHETPKTSNELLPQKIPRVIYQTFEDYEVPSGMHEAISSWKDSNPDYEHYFYNSQDRIAFLRESFDKDVVEAYLNLIPGAFKADLWRCCILYKKGGVYIDADMMCLSQLSSLIEPNDEFLVARDDPMSQSYLANGFIASVSDHPFLKKQIQNIVENVKQKRKCFYLDITGPGLLGKTVNEVCGRQREETYNLGSYSINNFKLKILKHCWQTKTMTFEDRSVLLTEYPNKIREMENINNPTFYSLVQRDCVYQQIPRNIFYTSKDSLALNSYMIDSFKKKNENWNMEYFSDEKCINFFQQHRQTFIDLLGFDALEFYQKHVNGGERSDFWRYCVIYLHGGLYTDTDTFCNAPLDNWIKNHDLVLGIEALIPLEEAKTFGMEKIGQLINNDTVVSVCNWTLAACPKHEFFKALILDIYNNPIQGNVLLHTGPGRLTKHAIQYFSGCDFSLLSSQDIHRDNSVLFSINRFGSNQSHSGSEKNYTNSFDLDSSRCYVIHMFDGTWRGIQNQQIKLFKSQLGVAHNMTIREVPNGFIGVSRIDKDTSATKFMEYIGDNRSVVELTFDRDMNLLKEEEKFISNYSKKAKFEDYRFFTFRDKTYLTVSYIDEDFNTKMAIITDKYEYIGDIKIPKYNEVSWLGGKVKVWEKNWLFLEQNGELFFIYSTTPKYVVYRCVDFSNLLFEEHINIDWPLSQNVPSEEHYFTANVGSSIKIATGGSNNPIFLKEHQVWIYMIHTKIYSKRKYNHYAIVLNKDLMPIYLGANPIINQHVDYALMFVSSFLENENYFLVTGGVEDNTNFSWNISKDAVLKKARLR